MIGHVTSFFPFSDLSNMVQLMLCHVIDFSTRILKIWEENVVFLS